MSKTELRPTPHKELEGHYSIELWHEGQFIGTVVGADGAGIRILTRRTIETHDLRDRILSAVPVIEWDVPNVLEVRLNVEAKRDVENR
jgi:hypothetical protein